MWGKTPIPLNALVLKAEVKFSIPGISNKPSDSEASLKTLTLAELDKSYPAPTQRIKRKEKVSHWNIVLLSY